jgi:hypothetical protein
VTTDVLSEGTLAVMEERRRKRGNKESYRCHGTCGRDLRPYRRTSAEFPDTTMEYSEARCRGCWYAMMAERHPGDPQYAVMECPKCGCATRPYRCPEDAMPGTRRRAETGLICYPCTNAKAGDATIEEVRANLNRFMSRIRGTSARVRNPYSPN